MQFIWVRDYSPRRYSLSDAWNTQERPLKGNEKARGGERVTRTGGVARETVRSRARYAVDGNATLRLAVGPPCSKLTVEGIKGQCLT